VPQPLSLSHEVCFLFTSKLPLPLRSPSAHPVNDFLKHPSPLFCSGLPFPKEDDFLLRARPSAGDDPSNENYFPLGILSCSTLFSERSFFGGSYLSAPLFR